MASSTATSSDLFAAKGRAMPACSKPLVKRSAPDSLQARAKDKTQDSDRDQDTPQDDGPASVLSIDLRRSLVPAPQAITAPAREAAPGPRVSHGITPLPQHRSQGTAGPFIAALVAISIAGGVFYVFGTDRLDEKTLAEAPSAAGTASAPSASAENAPPEEAVSSAEVSQPPEQESAAPHGAQGSASDGDEQTGPEDGSLPSFDLVRVEPDGAAVIAGRAAPYAELILLHNGEPIGKVKADWAGEWAFVTDKPLQTDRHKITLLVNDPDAEITLPEGADPPAQVGGLGNSQPR